MREEKSLNKKSMISRMFTENRKNRQFFMRRVQSQLMIYFNRSLALDLFKGFYDSICIEIFHFYYLILNISIHNIQMSFSISRNQLEAIVEATQKRTFAQEVQILQSKRAPLDWLASGLNTNFKTGIYGDEEDINERKQFYGSNENPVKDPPGFCQLVWEALEDCTLRILIGAALLTIIVQVATASEEERKTAWIEGFAILVAVFVCTIVTAANDYQKQREFRKLNQEKQKKKVVTVRRNGELIEVHQNFVLVGDVVHIAGGMEVPADGFILESNQLQADESAMTGETKPIKKNTLEKCIEKKNDILMKNKKNESNAHTIPSPIMLSGTNILTGQGQMVVIVVGDSSCLGKIRATLAQDEDGPTPLQNKLQKISEDIGKFGLYSAILILVVLLIRFGVQKGISKDWNTERDLVELLDYFVLALTVVVVAIPEGLPLAVTLSLAFSVKRMLQDNNLVRKLVACQTMGGANNICSDKTGTLTKNEMTLTAYWNGHFKDLTAQSSKSFQSLFPNEEFRDLLKVSCALNCSAQLKTQTLNEKGSATELAILKFLKGMGIDYQEIVKTNVIERKFPFNSEKKRMSTIIEHRGKRLALLKGASEIVLASCNNWINSSTGQHQPISQTILQQMKDTITMMAKKSLRTLCLACKELRVTEDVNECDNYGIQEFEKEGFTLVAIIGVRDVPRDEVKHSIAQCKKAGITVRMVTGDNLITARAIAEEIGIIDPNDENAIVMEGKDFIERIGGVVCSKCKTIKCECPKNSKEAKKRLMEPDTVRIDTIGNKDQFHQITDRLLVLARSRPEDKYALVTGLKESGNVVAVTGDGTNDAPALKKADVGFAMGISGTQVAKEASAIILLNDNFDSIVRAVMWGRNIYDSVRKFLQFQLTVNIVAVGITLIGAALFKQEILKPIQMLWLNLIMDTLGSLALATESPTEALLDRHPHKRDDYIISRTMYKHIIGQAVFQLIVLVLLLFFTENFLPEYPDAYDEQENFESDFKYTDMGTTRSGYFLFINGQDNYQHIFETTKVYSRHMTFIFNSFVMMQVFNFINARKINDQINIFSNILGNWMFIAIVGIIFVLQILLVTFAGYAFAVYSYFGLHPIQWAISIGIGFSSLIVGLILKFIPICECFPQGGSKEGDYAHPHSRVSSLKRRKSAIERDLSKNHLE